MNTFKDLIKTFDAISDWKAIISQNFERKSGAYSFATVTEIEIKYDNQVFKLPTKIVFEYGYAKQLRNIVKTEKVTYNKKILKVIEKKKVIPFGFYERRHKYSGEIYQILNDIIGNKINLKSHFSTNLLSTDDNPLYGIDSSQKWPSYILILENEETREADINKENYEFLNDILNDYGVHYNYEQSIKNNVVVIFPMPYIKVVENKIRRDNNIESIFLVLEFNQLPMFYTSQVKIEIQSLIKNIKNEIIFEKNETIKFEKAKYQVVRIFPEREEQIGFTSFLIRINGTLVNKFSGYYIREIKLDIKVK